MKKFLSLLFFLSFHFAYAGTGSANDEILFILAISAVLLLILAVYYSIYFLIKFIKKRRDKNLTLLAGEDNQENIS